MQKTKQPLLVKIWLTTFLLTTYCISACKNESDNTDIENYNLLVLQTSSQRKVELVKS